jgi:hypothetical protein
MFILPGAFQVKVRHYRITPLSLFPGYDVNCPVLISLPTAPNPVPIKPPPGQVLHNVVSAGYQRALYSTYNDACQMCSIRVALIIVPLVSGL